MMILSEQSIRAMTHWANMSVALCCALLVGCENERPALADATGTYQFESTEASATLVLKLDRTWEYRLLRPSELSSVGRWEHVPSADSSSTLAISLNDFSLGFPDWPGTNPNRRSNFFLNLERSYRGEIRSCLGEEYKRCFIKMSLPNSSLQ
jgi:hypothetical protein